ncbi:hypothetical protein [Orrella marina]|uniref:Pectate lyase superfamily protein domain-containing protein n=1 Tax=Orrella marina TaxID=2163011 RepID=A0A2R4XF17_9BURK|nr:hypothetical protein [Orrella marina]AWB32388.1 hypothetical protein DBV39_00190 [Orrella marina]
MSRNNTGNPIGSGDPRDREDNSKNLDEAVNKSGSTWTDRFGVTRKTMAGQESEFNAAQSARAMAFSSEQSFRESQFDVAQIDRQLRFNAFIAASGYNGTGAGGAIEDYAAGITITEYNQIIRDSAGEFWRLTGSTPLPYTTTGAGLPEGGTLVSVGDAVLRQEMALGVANYGVFVSPFGFGAVGDGIADDSDAFEAALNQASQTGRPFRGDGGRYRITRGIGINRTNHPPMLVDLGGAEVICDDGAISFGGDSAYHLTTTFSSYPARGDAKLTLASTAGVAPGDMCYIESAATYDGTIPVMHYYIVNEVDGNDVYIEGAVICDINEQQIIDEGKAGGISVNFYKLQKEIIICNGSFVAIDPNGLRTTLLVARHSRAVTANLSFSGHTRNQMYLQYCGYTVSSNIKVHDFGYIDKNQGYTANPNAPDNLSFGYGIIVARNYHSLITNVQAGRGWHAVDASRGQMHVIYDNLHIGRNAWGFSTHPGPWNVRYQNSTIVGGIGAQLSGGVYITLFNCTFRDIGQNINYGDCAEFSLLNCRFENKDGSALTTGLYRSGGPQPPGVLSVGQERKLIIKDCYFANMGSLAIAGYFFDTLILDGNVDQNGLWDVYCAPKTIVTNNKFIRPINYTIRLRLYPETERVLVEGNRSMGPRSSPSGTIQRLVSVQGTTNARIMITKNFTEIGAVLTVETSYSGPPIYLLADNTTATGRLAEGPVGSTILNSIGNRYALKYYQITATNDVDNVALVTS